jgi:hypothetical protein
MKPRVKRNNIKSKMAYNDGGQITKKDTYEIGDNIRFIDSFRKEEKDGTIYQINEVGTYVVNYGSGITAGIRGVEKKDIIGAYPKAEVKKKRFAFFEKGGEVADLEYSEILAVLRSKIDEAMDDINPSYESASDYKGEEVEHESRSGFIPYTDGGYEAVWFETLGGLYGSGTNLPTKPLEEEKDRQIEYNQKVALEQFIDNNKELVDEIGEDKVDYHSLYELGYGEQAEELSESEMSMMYDDTIMMRILANYYAPENSRAEDGKHSIRLFGDVNLESPYHRVGNLDDSHEYSFTFNSISELEEEMDKGLSEVLSWFNGDMYNDSKKKLGITRMAKGGEMAKDGKKTKSILDNIQKNDYISENEINLLKRRYNANENDESVKEVLDYIDKETYINLEPSQNKKGYDFLMKLWKTPNGKVREGNPFGNREQNILDNFSHFGFYGFNNAGRYGRNQYEPIYIVFSKDGSAFEYYYLGKVNIIGRDGHYGLGGKVSDIDSEIATNDLKEEVKSKMKKDDDVIHFAYTDYGGDFLDKVAIEYFEENYPKNIVVENTMYGGKNAFVFGKPATEWIESSENYILGFDDLESYYYERLNEEEAQGFEDFLNDLRMSYQFDKEEVMDWLMENRGGYYSVTTQGLDFSTSDLIDDLENEGLITKSNEYAKGGKADEEYAISGLTKDYMSAEIISKHKDFKSAERKFKELDKSGKLNDLFEKYAEIRIRPLSKSTQLYSNGGSIAEGNYHMILSQAKEVKHHVEELQDILKKEDTIEAWVVAKMENVSSTLSDITHYLDGKSDMPKAERGMKVKEGDVVVWEGNEYKISHIGNLSRYSSNRFVDTKFYLTPLQEGLDEVILDSLQGVSKMPMAKRGKKVEKISDELIEYSIPTWALPSLINGDDSGLRDEDIEKINKFVDKVVERHGNAFFMLGDMSEESNFQPYNDIDSLGADVTTLYIRPSKKFEQGGKTYPSLSLKEKDLNDDQTEIYAFIENYEPLNRQFDSIRRNLMIKIVREQFDESKAPKIFMYLIDNGLKAYKKMYGEISLTKKEKEEIANNMVIDFMSEAKLGNYESETFLPKKYLAEDGVMLVTFDIYDEDGDLVGEGMTAQDVMDYANIIWYYDMMDDDGEEIEDIDVAIDYLEQMEHDVKKSSSATKKKNVRRGKVK